MFRIKVLLGLLITAFLVLVMPAQAQASTYWAPYPFFNDSIPVYDRTGRTATMTAVNRWEHTGDGYNLWRTYSSSTAASRGVIIQWTSAYSGTRTAGTSTWYFTNNHTIQHCIIRINNNIGGGIGRPSGRLFEAIVSHEFGHCMGLKHDFNSNTNIMRPSIDRYSSYYKPTTTDKARARYALRSN